MAIQDFADRIKQLRAGNHGQELTLPVDKDNPFAAFGDLQSQLAHAPHGGNHLGNLLSRLQALSGERQVSLVVDATERWSIRAADDGDEDFQSECDIDDPCTGGDGGTSTRGSTRGCCGEIIEVSLANVTLAKQVINGLVRGRRALDGAALDVHIFMNVGGHRLFIATFGHPAGPSDD
jgi:hypothetical protein